MDSTDLTTLPEPRSKKEEEGPSTGVTLVPLIYAHLALTADLKQHSEWMDRVEKVEQAEAMADESDPKVRAVIARPAAWKKMRRLSKVATFWGFMLAAWWTGYLIHGYAVYLGFSWLAAASYALPIPIAWSVGREMFRSNVASNMAALGPAPTLRQRAKQTVLSTLGCAAAGFVAAFTLVFLQGLISWFMTPAPTIALELWYDFCDALKMAVLGGFGTSFMGPLLAVKLPGSSTALPDSTSSDRMALPGS